MEKTHHIPTQWYIHNESYTITKIKRITSETTNSLIYYYKITK